MHWRYAPSLSIVFGNFFLDFFILICVGWGYRESLLTWGWAVPCTALIPSCCWRILNQLELSAKQHLIPMDVLRYPDHHLLCCQMTAVMAFLIVCYSPIRIHSGLSSWPLSRNTIWLHIYLINMHISKPFTVFSLCLLCTNLANQYLLDLNIYLYFS